MWLLDTASLPGWAGCSWHEGAWCGLKANMPAKSCSIHLYRHMCLASTDAPTPTASGLPARVGVRPAVCIPLLVIRNQLCSCSTQLRQVDALLDRPARHRCSGNCCRREQRPPLHSCRREQGHMLQACTGTACSKELLAIPAVVCSHKATPVPCRSALQQGKQLGGSSGSKRGCARLRGAGAASAGGTGPGTAPPHRCSRSP